MKILVATITQFFKRVHLERVLENQFLLIISNLIIRPADLGLVRELSLFRGFPRSLYSIILEFQKYYNEKKIQMLYIHIDKEYEIDDIIREFRKYYEEKK